MTDITEIRSIGTQMANMMYNLSQGANLPAGTRDLMRDMHQRWDAAVSAAKAPPPQPQMVASSAPEILSRIAEVAAAVGFQAGEPAMELAGQIVSVLAGHPEHIDRFMDQGTELFLDGTFGIENGTLTYRAINGQILPPSVIREKKGTQQ